MKPDSNSPPPAHTGRLQRLVSLMAVAAFTAAFTLAVAPATPASAVTAPRTGYQGHAFGTYVSVGGGTVRSGPSSVIALGCGRGPGFRTRNSVATASFAPLLSSKNVATTGSTSASPDRVATTARAEDISVLGGAVSATAVKAVSISTHDSAGYHTSAAGSTVTGLKVFGLPVLITPGPNTTIPIPGIGYVVLNEQHSSVTATKAKLTVFAFHAYVNLPNLYFPVGTTAVIAGAFSQLSAPTAGFLGGGAYGTQANVGTLLTSGPSFSQALPCTGTGGVLRTNVGVGVLKPPFLISGAITNTARGTVTGTNATGETTSTVANASLLNGLVSVTLVKADAHGTYANGSTTLSDAGSSFGSISVNGIALVPANIKPNTVIQIAGVGTLYLRRTIKSGNTIEVRMVELVVGNNGFGIPVGADLRIAVAKVSAH